MNKELEILLKRLPKKYHDRVKWFERDYDLVDGCKYMLYWTDEYRDFECYGSCYPTKSISGAIDYVKNCLWK